MNYKFGSINENEEFLKSIQSHFNGVKKSIHKARNEIKIVPYKKQQYVVKSFKIPNLFKSILYTFFRDSKAKKSFLNSVKIGSFAPNAVGYIEFYRNGLLKDSYFVSEYFDYDFTIREPLLDSNFKDRDRIFRAFARFTLELHNNNIFHKDYSPGNILIKEENGEYIFKIVDINRMKFFKLSNSDRAKNFSKLWASDDVLEIIGNEYLKHYNAPKSFIDDMIRYNQKHKNFKNFKKRLKGIEVVD